MPVNMAYWGIPQVDPGWVYAVKTGIFVKVGKTTNPNRRLFKDANTWSPEPFEIVGVKPFWNIRRIEYSLHCALAEHWHRAEWFKFDDKYWLDFFIDAFREFGDEDRDLNSVNFSYWMNGTNYAESIIYQVKNKASRRQWQQCGGDPWEYVHRKLSDAKRKRTSSTSKIDRSG